MTPRRSTRPPASPPPATQRAPSSAAESQDAGANPRSRPRLRPHHQFLSPWGPSQPAPSAAAAPPAGAPASAGPRRGLTAELVEFDVPPAATRTTSRPPPTAASGTPASATGTLGQLDPRTGDGPRDPARRRLGAARRDRRARRRAVDHRRRPERDRPGRPGDRSEVERLPAAGRPRRTRTSTRPPSTATASSGSPARPASTAGSTPTTGRSRCSTAPRGRGPYGITTTPDGDVWYASLAGSHIARIDRATGEARRRAADRRAGRPPRLVRFAAAASGSASGTPARSACYDPARRRVARVAAARATEPQAYAVYVDDRDIVWLTDFGGQRDRPLRPGDRDVRARSRCRTPRGGAPDPRPPGRGLGRRVGRWTGSWSSGSG